MDQPSRSSAWDQTNIAETEPEPIATEPELIAAESKLIAIEQEPITVAPEPTATEPEPTITPKGQGSQEETSYDSSRSPDEVDARLKETKVINIDREPEKPLRISLDITIEL